MIGGSGHRYALRIGIALVNVLAFGIATARADWPYRVEMLAPPAEGGSRAAAINQAGWVAGEWDDGDGRTAAFFWRPETGIQIISGEGFEGGSRARALNRRGLVVGDATGTNGITRAFRWSVDDGPELLPVDDNTFFSMALAVNDEGCIVGIIENEGGVSAKVWAGEPMTQLPVPVADRALLQPLAINAAGDVAGQWMAHDEDTPSSMPFLVPGGSAPANSDSLMLLAAPKNGAALALNDDQLVVGYVIRSDARTKAFRYAAEEGFSILGDHDALYACAADVNGNGWIVGSFIPAYAADEAAALWVNDRFYDLNLITERTSDWWFVQATGINDDGVITGYGLFGDRNQAFILRPQAGLPVSGWPSARLERSPAGSEERIIRVISDEEVMLRRVVLFGDDHIVDTTSGPPWEFVHTPDQDGYVSFYAELHDVIGRTIRTPRIRYDGPGTPPADP